MNFLEKLNYLLNRDGVSKSQLARETGIPRSTIDNWFVRKEEDPKKSTLLKIANFFNVSLYYLCNDDNTEPTPPPIDDNSDIINFDGIGTIGLHFDGKIDELSEEEKKEIMNFVEFVVNKKNQKEKN